MRPMQEIYKEFDIVSKRAKADAELKDTLKQELRASADLPRGTKVLYKGKEHLVWFVNIYEKNNGAYCPSYLVIENKDDTLPKVVRGLKYYAKPQDLTKIKDTK